jgi:gluconate 5-dehydrogenase
MSVYDRFSLQGKIALVTGSTRGIGRAISKGLAEAGARVWVHGGNEREVAALAGELACCYFKADFTRPEEIKAMVDTIAAQEPRLDVLVNNAGVEVVMPFERIDMDTVDMIWMVNARAAVEVTHRLLPLLKQSPGASIINVTSIHDTMPYPHNVAYSMSKAALSMFTRTIAVELAPYGIRANNLAPGAVETEINRDVLDAIGRKRFREWIPVGRVASTDEMIGPALFLASDASRYVTGATLYADGGYLQNLVRYRPE